MLDCGGAAGVAAAVAKALRAQTKDESVTIKGVELSTLKVWTGQRLHLAVELGGLTYHFLTEGSGLEEEREWVRLAEALPTSQVRLWRGGNTLPPLLGHCCCGVPDVRLRYADWALLPPPHAHALAACRRCLGKRARHLYDRPRQPHATLTRSTPLLQGGLLPQGNWGALDRHFVQPIVHGSELPGFTVTGPLDLFLSKPSAVQLYLPHASDAGLLSRVLLREGASLTIRGVREARWVRQHASGGSVCLLVLRQTAVAPPGQILIPCRAAVRGAGCAALWTCPRWACPSLPR